MRKAAFLRDNGWTIEARDGGNCTIKIYVEVAKPLVIQVKKLKEDMYQFSHGTKKYDNLVECVFYALND
jgi:hypothetical protein